MKKAILFLFVVMFFISLIPSASALSSHYYFDSYSAGTAWATNPANMVDGNETSYASTTTNSDVELLNGNNGTGTNLGRISTVEIRAYGYYSSNDEVTLVPVFGGSSDGDGHTSAVPATTAAWGQWFDITSDTNAPATWSWDDVQNLDTDVNYVKSGGGQLTYVGEVEIRVNGPGSGRGKNGIGTIGPPLWLYLRAGPLKGERRGLGYAFLSILYRSIVAGLPARYDSWPTGEIQ